MVCIRVISFVQKKLQNQSLKVKVDSRQRMMKKNMDMIKRI